MALGRRASTPNGALIYAGGPALSVLALARTLQAAGAVRAMEMDINTDWVSAFTYVPEDPPTRRRPPIGVKLLDNMSHGGDQYLQPDERDFFAFPPTPRSSTRTTHHDHANDERPRSRSRAYRGSSSSGQEFMQ